MVLQDNKLLIVGNGSETHIGSHLLCAARPLGLDVRFCDIKEAFQGPGWIRKFNWWLRGHRPCQLKEFSSKVTQLCREFRPQWLLTVGLAPLEAESLKEIRKLGVSCLNYLTDDPWNLLHRAPWFMRAVPLYDHVFSVRRSNLESLRQMGCKSVSFLPFAYSPETHFPESPVTAEERNQFGSDVVFVGGADRDRLPWVRTLIREGFKLDLYGGYWERFRETQACSRGIADPGTVRKAVSGAKVALCLVRRANRDGNSMRTFEIPAIGACMLTEDTEEHREIFGEEGKAVYYFRSVLEMVQKLRWLLDHDKERIQLAARAHDLIIRGGHTYRDRLEAMLRLNGG